jgi:hypothetical protein
MSGPEEYFESLKPRVLILDIETAPLLALVWGLWQQDISATNGGFLRDWYMLSWAASWSDAPDDVFGYSLADFRRCKRAKGVKWYRDDKRLLAKLHEVLEEASVVVAHNGDRFDCKRINTRLLLNGFAPNTPYKTVDTLKVLKKHFAFSSNKLDYVSRALGSEGKIGTNFALWVRCLDGEAAAFEEMLTYNKRDITELWNVYVELRPWMSSYPNLALITGSIKPTCPSCASGNLEASKGKHHTGTGTFATYVCADCGARSRDNTNLTTKAQRSVLLRPV